MTLLLQVAVRLKRAATLQLGQNAPLVDTSGPPRPAP